MGEEQNKQESVITIPTKRIQSFIFYLILSCLFLVVTIYKDSKNQIKELEKTLKMSNMEISNNQTQNEINSKELIMINTIKDLELEVKRLEHDIEEKKNKIKLTESSIIDNFKKLNVELEVLKQKDKTVNIKTKDVTQDTKPQRVRWINSPMTQDWALDKSSDTWKTVLPFKDSMRPNPSIKFGLREDGTVIWEDNIKTWSEGKY